MSDSIKKYLETMENRWTADSTFSDNEIPQDLIVQRVLSKIKGRSKEGVKKYGTTLYDSPDGFYSFLNHLQEELMDAILYIEKGKTQK